MTHQGIREWEQMLRTAAPDSDDDVERDIWENSRSGRNPAAEQWLNDRVRYERGDTSHRPLHPTNWRGVAEEELPTSVSDRESNRDIDGDHDAFRHSLQRGLSDDIPDYGQFSLAGPPTEQYEPTSDERLKSDEGWLLGPDKQFDYPGGRAHIESIHNGMHQRGFELKNLGSDASPVPGYVHRETGARIAPSNAGWSLTAPGMMGTDHSSPASAAAEHKGNMDAIHAAETKRQQDQEAREYSEEQTRWNRSSDNIPKTKAQGMSWGNLFDEAVSGNEGHGREFERAAVKSVHNPSRLATGRLYGVHDDQWKEDFSNDAAGRGKVAQAIYHYQTPIAWKYHSVQPDGTYDEGKWRIPATSFNSAGWFNTGRVQNLMGPSLRRHNHEYLRDPLVNHRLHRALEEGGIRRQPDQSYKAVDVQGNTHTLAPSQSGNTVIHTMTTPDGSRTLSKRVPSDVGATTVFGLTQAPGVSGIQDPIAHLKSFKYRDSGVRRSSSVASWSDFLRD